MTRLLFAAVSIFILSFASAIEANTPGDLEIQLNEEFLQNLLNSKHISERLPDSIKDVKIKLDGETILLTGKTDVMLVEIDFSAILELKLGNKNEIIVNASQISIAKDTLQNLADSNDSLSEKELKATILSSIESGLTNCLSEVTDKLVELFPRFEYVQGKMEKVKIAVEKIKKVAVIVRETFNKLGKNIQDDFLEEGFSFKIPVDLSQHIGIKLDLKDISISQSNLLVTLGCAE